MTKSDVGDEGPPSSKSNGGTSGKECLLTLTSGCGVVRNVGNECKYDMRRPYIQRGVHQFGIRYCVHAAVECISKSLR